MKKKPFTVLFLFILILLISCSDSTPTPKEIIGKYRLIKIKENETMLTIGHQAQIILTETMYSSELDIDGDGKIEIEETSVAGYTYYLDSEERAYLKITTSDTPVELLKHHEYDLLLRKIDTLGNETIMYLEK